MVRLAVSEPDNRIYLAEINDKNEIISQEDITDTAIGAVHIHLTRTKNYEKYGCNGYRNTNRLEDFPINSAIAVFDETKYICISRDEYETLKHLAYYKGTDS